MASFCLMAVFIEPRLAILAELYVAILTGPEHFCPCRPKRGKTFYATPAILSERWMGNHYL